MTSTYTFKSIFLWLCDTCSSASIMFVLKSNVIFFLLEFRLVVLMMPSVDIYILFSCFQELRTAARNVPNLFLGWTEQLLFFFFSQSFLKYPKISWFQVCDHSQFCPLALVHISLGYVLQETSQCRINWKDNSTWFWRL